MNRVLAFLDDSPHAPDILRTAQTVASICGATLDSLHVRNEEPTSSNGAGGIAPADNFGRTGTGSATRVVLGEPVEVLLRELSAPDVQVAVLGARSLASKRDALGHVAQSLVLRTTVPLVVVPPGAPPLLTDDLTVLLPLDGHATTSASALPVAQMLTRHVGNVITLHVFDSASVPMFVTSDQDREVIAQNFLATHTSGLSTHGELRLGQPGCEILDVASCEHADAILLCWNQNLTSGHADVVRRLLAEAQIPIILQPKAH